MFETFFVVVVFVWSQHEIDSYDDRFQTAEMTGLELLAGKHEASDEIQEKVT